MNGKSGIVYWDDEIKQFFWMEASLVDDKMETKRRYFKKEFVPNSLDNETPLDKFRHTVSYKHQDGSECKFNYAYFEETDTQLPQYVIYTEHNGKHTIYKHDIEWLKVDGKIIFEYKDED